MNNNSKIYVAGHRGMVGSAIVRHLTGSGFTNLILKTSAELDLRNQQAVNDFFKNEKPEYIRVFLNGLNRIFIPNYKIVQK